jgi:glutamate--cysteine ligase
VPVYSLLCTSSAFIDHEPTQYAIARGNIWRNTDQARTGIPAILFDKDFGYDAWINMALDVPMYFIRRGKTYHDVAGASFREYIKQGLRNHQATIRDFVDHLSTIFTEIRLKPILELRSADSLPVPFVNALAALTWGLLYDEEAQQRAATLFVDVTHQEITALHRDAIENGRGALFRNRPIYSLSDDLITIASDALLRMGANSSHPPLTTYLMPLKNLIAKDITICEWIKAHYAKLADQQFLEFVKNFAPFNNPLA